jgi:acetyl esterase/lipase
MKMLQYLLLISVVIIISCKKSNTTNTGNLNTATAQTTLNVSYGADPLQKMDVYLPANRTTATTKTMILIHGGAWATGDKTDINGYIEALKLALPTYAIININYRLSDGARNLFPTQENDVKAAIDFIYNKRNEYLISDKLVLNGQSAGAHLALLHAYKSTSPVKIKAVVDFFGPTDLNVLFNNPGQIPSATIGFIIGATPSSNPSLYQQSSPINFVTAQSCPTIILQGGADLLVDANLQSLPLKNKLTANGVVNQYVLYPNGGHGDWDAATYGDAFNKIAAFVNANVQ